MAAYVLFDLTACSRGHAEAETRVRQATRAANEGIASARETVSDTVDTIVAGARTLNAIRVEFDRVYHASANYDLVVESQDAQGSRMREHQARIAAMPHVRVGELSVGYEESQTRSLRGVSYRKHFRAVWMHQGRRIALSYYSNENIDLAAFASLLERLVPIVQGRIEAQGA